MPRRRHRRQGRKRIMAIGNGGTGTGPGTTAPGSSIDSSSSTAATGGMSGGNGDMNSMATVMNSVNECDIKFVKYQSSPYEIKWTNEILTRELNPCLYIVQDIAEQMLYYEITQTSHDKHVTNMTRDNLFRVFSMFIYQKTCPNAADNMVFIEPIEPLNGFNRDHRSVCPGMMQVMPDLPKPKVGIQDRRFLLLSSKTNSPRIFQLHKAADYVPTLLILDIGAGSFAGAVEGTQNLGDSQAWFIRQYIPKGFKLGRYIAWEEFPMNAERYFDAIPAEMATKYTFFNTKISSDPSSRMYPWRFLSELAHDFDHIVVKMDNNQYQTEMELLKILASDPNLLELVDEMFFEYHIRNPPVKEMVAAEGGIVKATLGDAYDIFLKIRQAGVRIHGWP